MTPGWWWRRSVVVVLGAVSTLHAAEPLTPEQRNFFESHIRPVLAERCYGCHSKQAKKLKGDLLLDSKAGVQRGSEDGPVIVPGDVEKSLLIKALRYGDAVHAMPPKAKGGKLAGHVIADFELWVKMGAPDPREDGSIIEDGPAKPEQFWSLKRPYPHAVPKTADAAWAHTDIDRFLLASMDAEGLKPLADADRRTLIRRAAFDLTGLPPTAEEIDAFEKSAIPNPQSAIEELVDHYLNSPRFGECWGRHWLDVARYAESSGRNVNFLYAQAWRYRDYVIDAFNRDKPYNLFIKEQIAGDLMRYSDPHDQAAKLVATGFLAIGPKAHDELDRQKFLTDVADEQIDVVTQSMLGLTVACARCHDHKQDPITQRDYYALAGIFLSTETLYGTCYELQNWNSTSLIELDPDSGLPSALHKIKPEDVLAMEDKVRTTRRAEYEASFHRDTDRYHARLTREEASFAKAQLDLFKPDGTPRTLVMGTLDVETPSDTHLLIRGETSQPAELVPRGMVRVLCDTEPPAIKRGSGRLELANFIASERNPLTARVMVNRIWSKLFGRGIVATPDNFGEMGARPTHPELLDYLALDFMAHGWSVKHLIREIMLSRAYQLSSDDDERDHQRDPDNLHLWRMSKQRLDAEAIRDAMLAVSGSLDLKPEPGSLAARLEFEHDGPGRAVEAMHQHPSFNRSVYLPVIRGRVPEIFRVFDFADPSMVTGQRESTIVPSQDLHLLSDDLVQQYAEAFAARVVKLPGSLSEKAAAAFELAFARQPNARELKVIDAFIERFEADARSAMLPSFCHALFLSAEFRYLN